MYLASDNSEYDVTIIGGGPAGSTAGYILAKEGLKVLLLEKETFPRFHVGESLLPATNLVWERLGIRQEMEKMFLHKPGGRWFYNENYVQSDFSKPEKKASFIDYPHAYSVERAKFDNLLLENAARAGVEVRQNSKVSDLSFEGEKLRGIKVSNTAGSSYEVSSKMVFDCSGLAAVIAQKLGMRHPNRHKRMAVYAHYEAEAIEECLKNGWFVGGMIADGWVWTIPLSPEVISIGLVTTLENYKEVKKSPENYLSYAVDNLPYFKQAIKSNPRRISDVYCNSNIGYTSERFFGNGWVLVGDAAFFIDPCYSSGVHLAMKSAEMAADTFLNFHKTGYVSQKSFSKYEKHMRKHEEVLNKFVATFYMTTNNTKLRDLTPRHAPSLNKEFATFTGGDFDKNHHLINFSYRMGQLFTLLFPDRN